MYWPPLSINIYFIANFPHYEQCCNKHSFMHLFVHPCKTLQELISRSKIAGSLDIHIFNNIRYYKFISKTAVSIYTLSSVIRVLFASHFCPHLVLSNFLIPANLMGVNCFLIVLILCFLITQGQDEYDSYAYWSLCFLFCKLTFPISYLPFLYQVVCFSY